MKEGKRKLEGTYLQVALDCLSINEALSIARQVAEFIDVIEIGTPLLKAEGLKVVKALSEEFPDKFIFADTKTMDVGEIEARMAFEAGADMMSVCASAPIETIKSAISEARRWGKKVMVDLIGKEDMAKSARKIEPLGPDFFCVHTGIDQQKKGLGPVDNLKAVSEAIKTPVAVAGGIRLEHIAQIMVYRPAIVIVGGYITKAEKPGEAARALMEKIKGL